VAIALACIGLLSTVVTIVLSVIPSAEETNKPLAIAKVLGATAVLVGMGVALFLVSLWRTHRLSSHKIGAES
jgi:hypothetical protein